jgi:hypothetical protein
MSISSRARLFFLGFMLGCVLVYLILFRGRNRSYWLPENRVKEKLMKGNLIFTTHALCRMKCRAITEEKVKAILKNGNINFQKSHPHDTPCPTYAFEGITADKQLLRIIFASCDSITKVVTAIDLGLEKDTCECR